MDEFKPRMPLITTLLNPGMRNRHWQAITQELGVNLLPDDAFTLLDLFSLKLEDKLDIITKVTDVAAKEYSIEYALDKMESEWRPMSFDIVDYRDTGTYIIRAADGIHSTML